MRIIDALLGELDQEANTTARVLERVPVAHLQWRPHPKSMSLGQLALHIATTPGQVAQLASQEVIADPPSFQQPEAATASELVPTMRESVAQARSLLEPMDDQAMTQTWTLMRGGQVLLALPRVAFVRSVMLNHWYHHRGQLLAYLRMHDVPLPSVYGPTADENPFG